MPKEAKVSADRICDDFSDDLKEIATELFNSSDRSAQRKVHYWVSELPEEQRPRGLFKLGSRVCMMRSILRADLERRARGEPLPESAAINILPCAPENGVGASADHVHEDDALPAAAGAEAEAAVTAPRADSAP